MIVYKIRVKNGVVSIVELDIEHVNVVTHSAFYIGLE